MLALIVAVALPAALAVDIKSSNKIFNFSKATFDIKYVSPVMGDAPCMDTSQTHVFNYGIMSEAGGNATVHCEGCTAYPLADYNVTFHKFAFDSDFELVTEITATWTCSGKVTKMQGKAYCGPEGTLPPFNSSFECARFAYFSDPSFPLPTVMMAAHLPRRT